MNKHPFTHLHKREQFKAWETAFLHLLHGKQAANFLYNNNLYHSRDTKKPLRGWNKFNSNQSEPESEEEVSDDQLEVFPRSDIDQTDSENEEERRPTPIDSVRTSSVSTYTNPATIATAERRLWSSNATSPGVFGQRNFEREIAEKFQTDKRFASPTTLRRETSKQHDLRDSCWNWMRACIKGGMYDKYVFHVYLFDVVALYRLLKATCEEVSIYSLIDNCVKFFTTKKNAGESFANYSHRLYERHQELHTTGMAIPDLIIGGMMLSQVRNVFSLKKPAI